MESKSLIKIREKKITNKITMRIPTIGEILDDEEVYYTLTSTLTSSPFSFMVELDKIGIDFTTITDFDLFCMIFQSYSDREINLKRKRIDLSNALNDPNLSVESYDKLTTTLKYVDEQLDEISWGFSLIFKDFSLSQQHNDEFIGFSIYKDNNEKILYNPMSDISINKYVYEQIANFIRNINLYEKQNYKPANDDMKKYLLDREKRKAKRRKKTKYDVFLEKLVIAMVNNSDFPYNYDNSMNMSIYLFNQSFKQIQHKINFDKTMIGVYSGNIDVSKITNKECLSWINMKN